MSSPIESARESADRAQPRRRTGARLWFLLIAVLLVLASVLFTAVNRGRLYDEVAAGRLEISARAVMTVYNLTQIERVRELALLPPWPSDREDWARAVRDQLQQPAAVFVVERDSMTWPALPAAFQDMRGSAERVVMDTLQAIPVLLDTAGAFVLSRMAVPFDTARPLVLWLVESPLQDQRWGVVLDYYESWRHYFRQLQNAEASTRLNSMLALLEDDLQIHEQGEQTSHTGLRALLDGRVIYETPFLDTTHMSYVDELQRLRLEYYASWFDDLLWRPLRGWRAWQLPVFYTVVILILMAGCRRRMNQPRS